MKSKMKAIKDFLSLSEEHRVNYINSIVELWMNKNRSGTILEGPVMFLTLEELMELNQ